jgi:hypothetical protein
MSARSAFVTIICQHRNAASGPRSKPPLDTESNNDSVGTSTDLLIAEAVKRLDKIGFILPPDSDFDFHLAASKFTLHVVFGLGRILEIEQPITLPFTGR